MIGLSENLASPGWMLAHCTPLHHGSGISLPHVIAWCLLLGAVAGCGLLLWRMISRSNKGGDDVPWNQ